MKILELTLGDILELGQKPDPQKFIDRVQVREKGGGTSLKTMALKAIDDVFWKLTQEGKTTEEALEAMGLGMPKGSEGKPGR